MLRFILKRTQIEGGLQMVHYYTVDALTDKLEQYLRSGGKGFTEGMGYCADLHELIGVEVLDEDNK